MSRPNTFRPNAARPNDVGGGGLNLIDLMQTWADNIQLMLDNEWLEWALDSLVFSDNVRIVLGFNEQLTDSQSGNWADTLSIAGNTVQQYMLEALQTQLEGVLFDNLTLSDTFQFLWTNPTVAAADTLSFSDTIQLMLDVQWLEWPQDVLSLSDAFSYEVRQTRTCTDDQSGNWADTLKLLFGFLEKFSDSLVWDDSFAYTLGTTGVLSKAVTDDQSGNWSDSFSYRLLVVLFVSVTDSGFVWDDHLDTFIQGVINVNDTLSLSDNLKLGYGLIFQDDESVNWNDQLTMFNIIVNQYVLEVLQASDQGELQFTDDESGNWGDDLNISFDLGGGVVTQFGLEVLVQENPNARIPQFGLEVLFQRHVLPPPKGPQQAQPGLVWGPLARRRGRSFGHTKG